MKKPWEIEPDVDPTSIEWRMGELEYHLIRWFKYVNEMPQEDAVEYLRAADPPPQWDYLIEAMLRERGH